MRVTSTVTPEEIAQSTGAWGEGVGRLRSVLHVVNPDTGCWDWTGTLSWNGYARVNRDGRLQWAHRLYYQDKYGQGSIPQGMDLDHLCRNTKCVNPDHLEVVTKAENQRRGKAVRLSWGEVRFVREFYVPYDPHFGTRALGRRFNVSHETIRKVVHDVAWVDDPALVGGR